MLILVDGVDCSRKSTLVKQLADYVATQHPGDTVDVWHAGPPMKHPLDEYVTPLLNYRPRRGRHVICDRWHLGEAVYPRIFGRATKFDLAVQGYTELFLQSRGALLVHVDADVADVEDCLQSRGDEYVNPSQASDIIQNFRTRASASLLPTVILNGYKVTQETVDYLWRRALALDYVYQHLANFTTYVGSRVPRTLLLGDVRHGHLKGDATDLRSAFMPYGATSGHYLLAQLTENYGYSSLRSVGIVNACDDDDAHALHTLLRKPYTVALGRRASKVARWANHHADHPQFRRRFHYAEGEVYARQIFSHS